MDGSLRYPVAPWSGDPADAIRYLQDQYARSGYVRTPPQMDDPGTHRGYELRFTADSRQHCEVIAAALDTLGVLAGKPFIKGRLYRVPVYGREQVFDLCRLLNLFEREFGDSTQSRTA